MISKVLTDNEISEVEFEKILSQTTKRKFDEVFPEKKCLE